MRVKSATVLALCAVSFGLAACNTPQTPAGPTITPTGPASATPTGPASATPTGPVSATPTTGGKPAESQDQGGGRFVTITQQNLKGTRGTLTYDLDIPGLGVEGKGVNSEAARGFNSCMLNRADAFVNAYTQGQWMRDENKNSRVEHIGRHVLSGLMFVSVYGGGAHPFTTESTCVINADSSESITLKDVFTDESKGLQLLSEQAGKLLPASRAGDGFNKNGITPTAEHFQAWTATPEGMHVYFPQGQVGSEAAGSIDITIPWSALRARLKPGMLEVLAS